MEKLLRLFSTVFFLLAVLGIVVLVIFDIWNCLTYTSIHQRAGALSFMFIGASYIGLQLSSRQPWKKLVKEFLLGIAFFLWGCEQFLPPGPWATAMDSTVILIFVVDLSLTIVERLKSQDPEVP